MDGSIRTQTLTKQDIRFCYIGRPVGVRGILVQVSSWTDLEDRIYWLSSSEEFLGDHFGAGVIRYLESLLHNQAYFMQ